MKNMRVGAAAVSLTLAMAITGCASNESGNSGSGSTATGGSNLSGTITGSGATSQTVAQQNWTAQFQTSHSGVTINYSPEGSGAGRKAFAGGGADFAGSDAAVKAADNKAGGFGRCTADSKALDIPVYVSPIAIVFKVDGVSELNLTPDVLAGIFKGTITKWNDAKIAALNSGVNLPNANITAVHRSDDSGTTQNFTDYLNATAPSVWDKEASQTWPYQTGEAAKGTQGVTAAVRNGVDTIAYADKSQIGDLTMAKIGTANNFQAASEEGAAKAVENSPIESGRDANDLAIKLDRKADGYPIVLVSYMIVCADYKDDSTAANVKAYLSYITSSEGQQLGMQKAGAAPLTSALSEKVKTAVDSIK